MNNGMVTEVILNKQANSFNTVTISKVNYYKYRRQTITAYRCVNSRHFLCYKGRDPTAQIKLCLHAFSFPL